MSVGAKVGAGKMTKRWSSLVAGVGEAVEHAGGNVHAFARRDGQEFVAESDRCRYPRENAGSLRMDGYDRARARPVGATAVRDRAASIHQWRRRDAAMGDCWDCARSVSCLRSFSGFLTVQLPSFALCVTSALVPQLIRHSARRVRSLERRSVYRLLFPQRPMPPPVW